jgi:hypothetical protein
VKVSTGQLRASGEVLANPTGGPDDILVVAGQFIVTGPVATVGYRRVVVAGQVFAPRDSQPVLGPALIVKGQLIWYAGQPRFFVGKERFGRLFFELLDQPLSMALVGRFEIDPEVSPELLREKVAEITLVGKLIAPPQLVGVLQLLTTEKVGEIMVAEDDSKPR